MLKSSVTPAVEPVIVIEVPGKPLVKLRVVMTGRTAKTTGLLCPPAAVTTTLPVVTDKGTTTAILVSDQVEIVADWPLKETLPVAGPKLLPEIVTVVPALPLVEGFAVATAAVKDRTAAASIGNTSTQNLPREMDIALCPNQFHA